MVSLEKLLKEMVKLTSISVSITMASTTLAWAVVNNENMMRELTPVFSAKPKEVEQIVVELKRKGKADVYYTGHDANCCCIFHYVYNADECVSRYFIEKTNLLSVTNCTGNLEDSYKGEQETEAEQPPEEMQTEPVWEPVIESHEEPVSEPPQEYTNHEETETVQQTEKETEQPTEYVEPETEPPTEYVEPETEPPTEYVEPETEPPTDCGYKNVDASILQEAQRVEEAQWDNLQRTVDLINEYRLEYGLPALDIDVKLGLMACYRSEEHAANLMVSHTRPDGRDCLTIKNDFGYSCGIMGEVCGQYQEVPEEIVYDWMASPEHAAILMSPTLTRIGIGVVAGSNGGLFWTGILADR